MHEEVIISSYYLFFTFITSYTHRDTLCECLCHDNTRELVLFLPPYGSRVKLCLPGLEALASPLSHLAGPSSCCFLSSYYNLNVKCPPQTYVFANLVPTWVPVWGGCRILRGRGSVWRWYLRPASTSCFLILWDVRSRHLLLLLRDSSAMMDWNWAISKPPSLKLCLTSKVCFFF